MKQSMKTLIKMRKQDDGIELTELYLLKWKRVIMRNVRWYYLVIIYVWKWEITGKFNVILFTKYNCIPSSFVTFSLKIFLRFRFYIIFIIPYSLLLVLDTFNQNNHIYTQTDVHNNRKSNIIMDMRKCWRSFLGLRTLQEF